MEKDIISVLLSILVAIQFIISIYLILQKIELKKRLEKYPLQ